MPVHTRDSPEWQLMLGWQLRGCGRLAVVTSSAAAGASVCTGRAGLLIGWACNHCVQQITAPHLLQQCATQQQAAQQQLAASARCGRLQRRAQRRCASGAMEATEEGRQKAAATRAAAKRKHDEVVREPAPAPIKKKKQPKATSTHQVAAPDGYDEAANGLDPGVHGAQLAAAAAPARCSRASCLLHRLPACC